MEAIIIGFLEKLEIKSRRSFVLLNLSCFSSISQETKEPKLRYLVNTKFLQV